MPTRRLGNSSIEVSALGLGCMPLSSTYGASDEAEALAMLDRAIELGVTLLDTADVYGDGHNEALIGRAIRGRLARVVLASKFGQISRPGDVPRIDGRPAYVARACEASLKRLGVETIDLYYQEVNAAIRRHLQADNLAVAIVTRDAAAFRDELLSGEPSTVTYNTDVGEAILAEDEAIRSFPLAINRDRVRVVPVGEMFVEVN